MEAPRLHSGSLWVLGRQPRPGLVQELKPETGPVTRLTGWGAAPAFPTVPRACGWARPCASAAWGEAGSH